MIMVWLLAHRPEIGGFVAPPPARSSATRHHGARASPRRRPSAPAARSRSLAPGWLTLAALVLITSLGPWALPQMVQKFYSIRSRADVTRALVIAGVFSLFMSFGAYFSGALTHLYYGAEAAAPSSSGRRGRSGTRSCRTSSPRAACRRRSSS